MRTAFTASVAIFLLCLTGCSHPEQPASRAAEYKPVFAAPTAGTPQAGTVRGDYDNAAHARNLREAASRWEQFLEKHRPASGEYEDAFQKMLIDSATYELIRVYYLLGERDKGDDLLKQLDPLQLR
jgi:hypothetical protein